MVRRRRTRIPKVRTALRALSRTVLRALSRTVLRAPFRPCPTRQTGNEQGFPEKCKQNPDGGQYQDRPKEIVWRDRRKQNLVLFFKENEEFNVMNSRLVRMYMNRFTIDEEDQTEVTEVYYIKSGTRKEYNECFSKSLRMERENKTANTDTHFILGNERQIEYPPVRSVVFQLKQVDCKSP